MRMEKNCFNQGFSLVSSMLIVLGAPCLSEHICTNAGPTFSPVSVFPLLCPQCAWSRSSPSDSLNIMLLKEKLIRLIHLVFHLTSLSQRFGIMCLCCPHNCLISSEYNRVTKCLEWRFTTFIDLDFKPVVCFEECINQRDWHQQAFHWVHKKREPLKIARLLL